MRPPQIEDCAAALDDGAVDHTRDDWRNLAVGDRDHVLVEIRDTRGDVTEFDQRLTTIQPPYCLEVVIFKARRDRDRALEHLARGGDIALHQRLQSTRHEQLAMLYTLP